VRAADRRAAVHWLRGALELSTDRQAVAAIRAALDLLDPPNVTPRRTSDVGNDAAALLAVLVDGAEPDGVYRAGTRSLGAAAGMGSARINAALAALLAPADGLPPRVLELRGPRGRRDFAPAGDDR